MRRITPLCAVVAVTLSCSSHHGSSNSTGPAPAGTIAGTITSSLGGSLAGVHVVVIPAGGGALAVVTTTASGGFVATNVPVTRDDGTITLSALPPNCPAPSATSYTGLTGGDTVTVNVLVVCSPLVGTLRGTVTSSLGGGLANVSVIATPHNGAALGGVLTGASGTYVVSNVPIADSTGSVTLANLPANCSAPAGAPSYSGLGYGDTATVNVTVTCVAGAGAVTGTVTSSGGTAMAGVQVVVTPSGGTAPPAVTTNASGVYTVGGVPIGTGAGTVAVSGVPGYCTAPSVASYTGLTSGVTVTTNITVPCATATGTVTGTVTSSLGGALAGAQVVVTPTGGTAFPAVTTTNSGSYTVTRVPVGGGAVTITGGLPPQCSAPSAVAYAGLAYNKTDTVNVVAPCQIMGSLAVKISEPATALGSVTVTGPAGYVRTFTQSTTLTGLVPGAYAVTSSPFETPDAIVGTVWEGSVASSPVQVTAGTTAQATVTYHARPGTGALWVIMPDYNQSGGTWGYYTSAQLAAGGSQMMAFSTSIPSGVQVNGMAVDANGTMWMVDNNNGAVDAFKAAGGFLTPASVDTLLPEFNYALFGAAFDPAGNLWTMNDDQGLVVLSPAQLAAGGNSSPRLINYVGTLFPNLNSRALTFDAGGTMWLISRHEPKNSLEPFTQAQLNAGGSQSPSISILLPDSLSRALAFDAGGNLWVSFFGGQGVGKYTPAQLAAGGSPTPAITIGVTNPSGLAFDASGNLWVVDAVDGQLFEFTSSQLTASGTPTPAITMPLPVQSNSFDPQQPFYLVFNPHASNLPLNGSRITSRPNANAPRTPQLRGHH